LRVVTIEGLVEGGTILTPCKH